jgi:hypothetical protein
MTREMNLYKVLILLLGLMFDLGLAQSNKDKK